VTASCRTSDERQNLRPPAPLLRAVRGAPTGHLLTAATGTAGAVAGDSPFLYGPLV
jgi:hypothetical protein